MTDPRNAIHAALESQRFIAQQAGRERPAAELVQNALERAGELALAGFLAESRRLVRREIEAQE